MAKWRVYARAFDRTSGVPIGNRRRETIDTDTNRLFHGAITAQQVHVAYEDFWNKLNPQSKEVVLVSKVERVEVV